MEIWGFGTWGTKIGTNFKTEFDEFKDYSMQLPAIAEAWTGSDDSGSSFQFSA